MSDRKTRALLNLAGVGQRTDAILQACQTQVADTRDVCAAALAGDYTPEQGFADMTALWINGLAIVGAIYGFVPPAPSEDPGPDPKP